jgi:Mor family transcriptional regulator
VAIKPAVLAAPAALVAHSAAAVTRLLPEGYPELLEVVACEIYRELGVALSQASAALAGAALTEGDRAAIAFAVTEKVRQVFGGHAPYIAKGQLVELNARDQEIYAKHCAGVGLETLARDYDLTTRQIYSTIAHGRRLTIKARQRPLDLG